MSAITFGALNPSITPQDRVCHDAGFKDLETNPTARLKKLAMKYHQDRNHNIKNFGLAAELLEAVTNHWQEGRPLSTSCESSRQRQIEIEDAISAEMRQLEIPDDGYELQQKERARNADGHRRGVEAHNRAQAEMQREKDKQAAAARAESERKRKLADDDERARFIAAAIERERVEREHAQRLQSEREERERNKPQEDERARSIAAAIERERVDKERSARERAERESFDARSGIKKTEALSDRARRHAEKEADRQWRLVQKRMIDDDEESSSRAKRAANRHL